MLTGKPTRGGSDRYGGAHDEAFGGDPATNAVHIKQVCMHALWRLLS